MAFNVIGILTSLFSAAAWRAHRAKREGVAFDRRYGTDTFESRPLAGMPQADQTLRRHAVQYEVSAIPKFRHAMECCVRAAPVGLHRYSFVDFGSGKGLAVMLASRLHFKHVYGVEMSPELHRIAQENLRRFGARMAGEGVPVTLVCANALEFDWPDGDVLAYLYNPFDALYTQQFAACVEEEVERRARTVIVAYVNPVHRAAFDGSVRFERLSSHHTVAVYVCRPSQQTVVGSDG